MGVICFVCGEPIEAADPAKHIYGWRFQHVDGLWDIRHDIVVLGLHGERTLNA